jgi:hypothetical protein
MNNSTVFLYLLVGNVRPILDLEHVRTTVDL